MAFAGAVRCLHGSGPLGLTLSGTARGHEATRTDLAFSGRAPMGLPATLADAVIEQRGAGEYRIVSREGTWTVAATAAHLRREVADEFYRALPPRPAPAAKRLLWWVVLALAGSRGGLALLRTLRR